MAAGMNERLALSSSWGLSAQGWGLGPRGPDGLAQGPGLPPGQGGLLVGMAPAGPPLTEEGLFPNQKSGCYHPGQGGPH